MTLEGQGLDNTDDRDATRDKYLPEGLSYHSLLGLQ